MNLHNKSENNNQALAHQANGKSGQIAQVQAMGVEAVVRQQEMIREILSPVPHKGTHYGTINGCGDRLVLLKPCAAKNLSCFAIRPKIQAENLATSQHEIYYRLIASGSTSNGAFMGDRGGRGVRPGTQIPQVRKLI